MAKQNIKKKPRWADIYMEWYGFIMMMTALVAALFVLPYPFNISAAFVMTFLMGAFTFYRNG